MAPFSPYDAERAYAAVDTLTVNNYAELVTIERIRKKYIDRP